MLIELHDISYKYAGASDKSLKNVSFTMDKGECILLTGESGCGKTTLTRIINGLCPKFYGGTFSGSYLLDGKNAQELELDEIGKYIGNVFQDPRSQFFTSNVTDEIVLAMENQNYTRERMKCRLYEISTLLGIENLLEKDLLRLSSGEKQKVAVAAACVTKPKILVLDEPSANLDADSTRQLGELLYRLKMQGMTIIISEHRLEYLADLIDKMVLMKNGEIIAVYSGEEARHLSDDRLCEMGLRLFYPHDYQNISTEIGAESFLQMKHIVCKCRKATILDRITLYAAKGKILAITGRNGTGKTTLCRIAAGLRKENSGDVIINGVHIRRQDRLKKCFFVGQDSDYQLYAPTVLDEILLNRKKTPETIRRAEQLLQQLDLSAFSERHPASLSGGQKQRVLLAVAVMWERPVLILDEPTSGLDGRHMREMASLLRKIADDGMCIILITHDAELIGNCADAVYKLECSCLEKMSKEVF
ncbi:MAG: ABC transporter ATP-binding protein [Oscillospiraceae bacterium]|nr:ABC transporter ATP-binding protein [Oscillospiraceae bacterium]